MTERSDDIKAALDTTIERFGRLDIAFNNAGIEQPITPAHEIKGQAGYAASKHGIIGLTKSSAIDYAPKGIRINGICPGIIDTQMMRRFAGDTDEGRAAGIAQEPIGRMGMPDETAAAVLWLCSDEAGFTVGHAMVIDGGQTA